VEWVSHITNCNLHNNRLARAVTSTPRPSRRPRPGNFLEEAVGVQDAAVARLPWWASQEEKLMVVTDSADVIPVPSATPRA